MAVGVNVHPWIPSLMKAGSSCNGVAIAGLSGCFLVLNKDTLRFFCEILLLPFLLNFLYQYWSMARLNFLSFVEGFSLLFGQRRQGNREILIKGSQGRVPSDDSVRQAHLYYGRPMLSQQG